MKILITTPDLSKTGGVSAFYQALRSYLPADAEYFTVGARGEGETGIDFILRGLGDCRRFLRTVAGGGWELVHLNPSFGGKALARDCVLLLIAKCFRIPAIVQVHGWDWKCVQTVRRRFVTPFVLAYGTADAFVVLAEEFRAALKAMGIRSPVFVESATVAPCPGRSAANRSHRPGGEAALLFLSRMERDKGIYETVDAFASLRKRYPGLTLSVAGDGPELPRVQGYVRDRGTPGVRFLGHVQGARKHLAFMDADIFVLPSHSEGMPVALLEAMVHGLPLVTCPVGGIRDFFREGEMGFLSKVGDAASIASALDRLLADAAMRAGIGARNREFALERFMPWTTAERLGRIYHALTARKDGIQGGSWLDDRAAECQPALEANKTAATGGALGALLS